MRSWNRRLGTLEQLLSGFIYFFWPSAKKTEHRSDDSYCLPDGNYSAVIGLWLKFEFMCEVCYCGLPYRAKQCTLDCSLPKLIKKYFTQRRQDAEKERRKEEKKERKTKGRSFCGLIIINNLFSKRVFHIAF